MSQPAANNVFDLNAEHVIAVRLHILSKHADVWAANDNRWRDLIFNDDSTRRQELATTIQQSIRSDKDSPWHQRLHALGISLGIVDDVQKLVLVQCLNRGWFDQPLPGRRQRQRPQIEHVQRPVATILIEHTTAQNRATALRKQQLCRDLETAQHVAQEFDELRITRTIISRVCSLLNAWSQYGQIGLLHQSPYPFYEELRLLGMYTEQLAPDILIPADIINQVRIDLIGLCRGLHRVHPKLWHQHLLTEPIGSRNRQRYHKDLFPRLRTEITSAIAHERECDVERAEDLFNLYIWQGLDGLIYQYSPSRGDSTQGTLELLRAMRIIKRLCVGLDLTAQQEITHLTPLLFMAVRNAGISLSLVPLLTEPPSSRRRIAWGRRFSFGVPSIVRKRKKKQPPWLHQKQPSLQTLDSESPSVESELVTTFANLTSLEYKEATDRLRNIIMYGVLGFVPRSLWSTIIDSRVFSWLHLMKFGRLKRAVKWPEIYQVAVAYCETLDITPPSSQVLKALYNSIIKPRHWNAGKGFAVIKVHKRVPQVVTGLPRLHAAWLITKIKLAVGLDDDEGNRANSSYLLLVVDAEAELPIGVWLSTNEPHSCEVGLALYQAIWHPGAIQWPIRGIPQTIYIPAALVNDGYDDIQRAAHYLLSTIDVTDASVLKGKKRTLQMIEDIKQHLPNEIRRVGGTGAVTTSQALRITLDWLVPRYFPAHRQEKVRRSIRQHLVGMPGFDTPAAGWLLPQATEMVAMDGQGVMHNGRSFSSKTYCPEPGQIVAIRRFPYFYPVSQTSDLDQGIFIETLGDKSSYLHYLTATTDVGTFIE